MSHLEDLAEKSKPFEELWYGGHVSIIEKNKGYNANVLNALNVMQYSTHKFTNKTFKERGAF